MPENSSSSSLVERMSPNAARLVLALLVVLAALLVWIGLGISEPVKRAGPTDLDTYQRVVEALRGGQNYYLALHAALLGFVRRGRSLRHEPSGEECLRQQDEERGRRVPDDRCRFVGSGEGKDGNNQRDAKPGINAAMERYDLPLTCRVLDAAENSIEVGQLQKDDGKGNRKEPVVPAGDGGAPEEQGTQGRRGQRPIAHQFDGSLEVAR